MKAKRDGLFSCMHKKTVKVEIKISSPETTVCFTMMWIVKQTASWVTEQIDNDDDNNNNN